MKAVGFRRRASGARRAGFTMVELMVAITGGLFVSIAVFVLAKHSTHFYQNESRVGTATFGAVIGFDRLRADIGRAGYLTSPNIDDDPSVCNPNGWTGWPARLRSMGSVFIEKLPTADLSPVLSRNGRTPDRIALTGSYASSDQFETGPIDAATNSVILRPNSPAMARLGYTALTANPARELLLQSLFIPGRVLRVVDKTGRQQYGIIQSATVGANGPTIVLDNTPPLTFRSGNSCGINDLGVGSFANVVNIVQYSVRKASDSNVGYEVATGDGGAGAPFDNERTELVREELSAVNGLQIAGTEEIVTEFAVDLQFGLTVASAVTATGVAMPDQTDLVVHAPNAAIITTIAGDPTAVAATPQRIRAVRVRFSVRSRQPDRTGDVLPVAGEVAAGFYRIRLDDNTATPKYARVRTVQSDVALRNQLGVMW